MARSTKARKLSPAAVAREARLAEHERRAEKAQQRSEQIKLTLLETIRRMFVSCYERRINPTELPVNRAGRAVEDLLAALLVEAERRGFSAGVLAEASPPPF